MDPAVKQLKIKSGSVKRLQKEYVLYQQEEKKQREKVDQVKQEGADEYEVKKQIQFLEETQSVLPGCKTRLQDTLNDMISWLNENGDNLAVKDSQEIIDAKEIIEGAQNFLEQLNAF